MSGGHRRWLGRRGERASWAILGACSALILALSAVVPLYGFWVVDSGTRYLQLINLVDHHGMRGAWVDYPWSRIDPEFRLNPAVDGQLSPTMGRLTGQYPPTLAYLAALPYAAFGLAGARGVATLAAIALLGAMFHLGRSLGMRRVGAASSAATVVLGTSALPYAYIYWDILPALATGSWAIALAARATLARGTTVASGAARRPWGSSVVAPLACAGATAGLAFAMREEYAILAATLAIGIALCSQGLATASRRLLAFAAGVALVATPYMAMNMATIGRPLYLMRARLHDMASSTTAAQRLAIIEAHLTQATERRLLDVALFMALLAGSLLATRLALARGKAGAPVALASLAGVVVVAAVSLGIRSMLWAPSFPLAVQKHMVGFACAAPVTFLGFGAITFACKPARFTSRYMPLRLALASAVGFAVLFVLLAPQVTTSAFHFGPRLLLPTATVLALVGSRFVGGILRRASGTVGAVASALLLALVAIGFADNAFYLDRLRLKAEVGARSARFFQQLPKRPILTNVLWFPMDLAFMYYDRPQMGTWKPGQEAESLTAARRVSSGGAYLVTYYYDDPRPLAESPMFTARELPATEAVRFPDPAYAFRCYELTWKPAATPPGVSSKAGGS